MKKSKIVLDNEELGLLEGLESGKWSDKPLTDNEINTYQESAKYTKSLQEKNKLLSGFQ